MPMQKRRGKEREHRKKQKAKENCTRKPSLSLIAPFTSPFAALAIASSSSRLLPLTSPPVSRTFAGCVWWRRTQRRFAHGFSVLSLFCPPPPLRTRCQDATSFLPFHPSILQATYLHACIWTQCFANLLIARAGAYSSILHAARFRHPRVPIRFVLHRVNVRVACCDLR